MKLHEAIAVTYSIMGQDLTDAALEVVCNDLKDYPLPAVLTALERCRKECRRIALVDIIARITETKALTMNCGRCFAGLMNGRTFRLGKWVCPACETAYQAGEWDKVTA